MGIVLYFVLGVLNIGLLYWIAKAYNRASGINLFPTDASDIISTAIVFILSGYFGTMMVIAIGAYLFSLWMKYYRKK